MDPAVDAIVRFGLALLFGAAAAHKLRDLVAFRAILDDYRVLPAALVPAAALVVVAAEVATALLVVAPGGRALGALAAAALLALYAAAIAANLARGRRDIDCGCGGPGGRRTLGAGLVVRNVVLAAIALATRVPPRARELAWTDVVTIAGGVAVLAATYAAADALAANRPAMARARGVA
jgi:hypothetical protein